MFHPKTLAPSLRKAWKSLAHSGVIGDFYLAGGTALALRLGHRVSVDMDFFSPTNTLGAGMRGELISKLSRFHGRFL